MDDLIGITQAVSLTKSQGIDMSAAALLKLGSEGPVVEYVGKSRVPFFYEHDVIDWCAKRNPRVKDQQAVVCENEAAPKAGVVTITPEMARSWLADNVLTIQRKLRDGVVDRYARDMTSGQWRVTHQGIAFDSCGRLIDGQHRLTAIVKAGIPVDMIVVRGVSNDAYDRVDLGYGRRASDVFKAQGAGWITNEHIAVARFIEFGVDMKAITVNRSPFELRALVEKHALAIDFVFSNLERRVRTITNAPILSAIGLAYYHELDKVKLVEFIRILVSGVAVDQARDASVIKFRDWLRDSCRSVSTVIRYETFLKTQRVIKAYMCDERLTKIYVPSAPIYTAPNSGVVDQAMLM